MADNVVKFRSKAFLEALDAVGKMEEIYADPIEGASLEDARLCIDLVCLLYTEAYVKGSKTTQSLLERNSLTREMLNVAHRVLYQTDAPLFPDDAA